MMSSQKLLQKPIDFGNLGAIDCRSAEFDNVENVSREKQS